MKGRERNRFAADELAVVLSHYDLGVIESITEFKRGSRRSPKVGIVCERGKFLLKKRDRSRGGPDRMRYSHAIQRHLRAKSFPLPSLIPARMSDDAILLYGGAMYELFDFVAGHSYTGSVEETRDAGGTLASFHAAMADFPLEGACPSASYHDALAVQTGLNAIPSQVSSHESAAGRDAEILGLTTFLYEAYEESSQAVEAAGYEDWPDVITHSDWHPGNLLFKRGRVLAVIDYDCAKVGKAITDVANGALQFSIVGGNEPTNWPDHLDMKRYTAFLEGYCAKRSLAPDQMRAFPHLMIEALIAESVLPIAATGSFGPFPGYGFMRMVRRKVRWMQEHIGELQEVRTS